MTLLRKAHWNNDNNGQIKKWYALNSVKLYEINRSLKQKCAIYGKIKRGVELVKKESVAPLS